MAVYCIRTEDNTKCKIGYSLYPFRRLKDLQVGNPEQLRMFAICSGNVFTEKQFHALLVKYKLKGEWFDFSECEEEIVELFKTTKNPIFFDN